jgi:hypothetical protein
MPSVHCVVRSLTKLTRMRGENCVDASVIVISNIANTIDTTVMIDVAMLLWITWATPGSWREGKRTPGIQALTMGVASSSHERAAPAAPKTKAIANGRMRKPPRSAYIAERNKICSRSNILKTGITDRWMKALAPLGKFNLRRTIKDFWAVTFRSLYAGFAVEQRSRSHGLPICAYSIISTFGA